MGGYDRMMWMGNMSVCVPHPFYPAALPLALGSCPGGCKNKKRHWQLNCEQQNWVKGDWGKGFWHVSIHHHSVCIRRHFRPSMWGPAACPADRHPPRWSTAQDSITRWHSTVTAETRSFSEWQRRSDWSEERWCFVNWIMGTPLWDWATWAWGAAKKRKGKVDNRVFLAFQSTATNTVLLLLPDAHSSNSSRFRLSTTEEASFQKLPFLFTLSCAIHLVHVWSLTMLQSVTSVDLWPSPLLTVVRPRLSHNTIISSSPTSICPRCHCHDAFPGWFSQVFFVILLIKHSVPSISAPGRQSSPKMTRETKSGPCLLPHMKSIKQWDSQLCTEFQTHVKEPFPFPVKLELVV